jgi:pimeloyl-ACP methyl ester carboxylesterase
LVGLIVVLAIAGATYQAVGTALDARKYPPPGRLVDVGNHRLHINCTGEGSPTVILESGGGAWSLDWSWVQPEIAKVTRVCSYDRAGYGWSDPGPSPRTSQQIIWELQALLAGARVDGPYVLVGSSFGGHNVRLYTAKLPDDVVGVVLVDVSHEDQPSPMPQECWEQQVQQFKYTWVFSALGLVRLAGVLGMAPELEKRVARFPPAVQPVVRAGYYRTQSSRTLYKELAVYDESAVQVRAAAGSLGERPLVVLTAGAYEYPLFCQPDPEQKGHRLRQWTQRHAELANLSTNGTHSVVEKSGHFIHLDQPGSVVDAIRRVINEAGR